MNNECTSSDEVNAMFAEAEENEIAEERELEKQMEREQAVGSGSSGASDVSDDTEEDDFKYLEPRRSKRRGNPAFSPQRQSFAQHRARPMRSTTKKDWNTDRDSAKLRKSAAAAAKAALSANILSSRQHRFNTIISESDSDVADLDEFTWSQRERRRLVSAQNNIQPMNMEMGGIASGGLASRSPFRNSAVPNISSGAPEPLKVDASLSWEHIGGLDDYIRALKEMIVLPLVYPEVFEQFKLEPPKGVLFHGPPGTGKTLMARALAAACSAGTRNPVAFFMRNGADCLSKWVGEAERQLRLTFEAARARQPAIIFFDEIDGLAPVRSSKQDQIHSSIVSTLLGLMDGLDSRGQIVVIGATNRIDAIDPALRRPGRFDREFVFSLPNTQARRQILEIHTREWFSRPPRELLHRLAKDTVGYCGADLKALCSEAALQALRRRYPQIYRSTEKLLIDPKQVLVGENDFIKAMSLVVPTAHRAMRIHGRPLDREQSLLLSDAYGQILELMREVNARSSSGKGGRFLIHGMHGNGQTALGQALLQEMEDRVLHTLDLPMLLADPSTRTPEESLLTVLREAARTSAAVIYLPHLELWAGPNREMLRTILLVGLRDLRRDASVFVYATAEEDVGGLVSNAAVDELSDEAENGMIDLREVVRYFAMEGDAVYRVENPHPQARKRLFDALISEVTAPLRCDLNKEGLSIDNEDDTEELPVIPMPEYSQKQRQDNERLRQRENRVFRELRLIMRDFVERLLSDRKYKPFWNRVSEAEAPDYFEIVKEPIDLSEILDRVNRQEIQTMQDLIAAFELLAQNALQYNPEGDAKGMRIRSKAIALLDIVHRWAELLMDPEENEEEAAIIAECASIAERRQLEISEQQKMRRQTRSLGADGLVSFSEASRLVARSRRHSRSEEKGGHGNEAPQSTIDIGSESSEAISPSGEVCQTALHASANATALAMSSKLETLEVSGSSAHEPETFTDGNSLYFSMIPQSMNGQMDSISKAPLLVESIKIGNGQALVESLECNALVTNCNFSARDHETKPDSMGTRPFCERDENETARRIDSVPSACTDNATCGQGLSSWVVPKAAEVSAALEALVDATVGLSMEDLLRLYDRLAHFVRQTHAYTSDRNQVLKEMLHIARSCHPRDVPNEKMSSGSDA
jgi:SpoVK/Ycf46/Vps4 family AAA+-type ATPase